MNNNTILSKHFQIQIYVQLYVNHVEIYIYNAQQYYMNNIKTLSNIDLYTVIAPNNTVYVKALYRDVHLLCIAILYKSQNTVSKYPLIIHNSTLILDHGFKIGVILSIKAKGNDTELIPVRSHIPLQKK